MEKQRKIVTVLLFVLIFTSASAQSDPATFKLGSDNQSTIDQSTITFTDDVEDVPLPINDYLPQALFTAFVLGYYFFSKKAIKKE
jgi:hypothetical protein